MVTISEKLNTRQSQSEPEKRKRILAIMLKVSSIIQSVEPRYFEVPREMEKKFEIARFRNNRGSVKFVTMNHFLLKYVCNYQYPANRVSFDLAR